MWQFVYIVFNSDHLDFRLTNINNQLSKKNIFAFRTRIFEKIG